jgi:hypothetical protein
VAVGTVTAHQQILQIDWQSFADALSREPLGVHHNQADHPLFTLEAIAALADRLPPGSTERHAAKQERLVPGGAPDIGGPPSETVLGIEESGCWMVLWYIEQDSDYKELLDACLDPVAAHLGDKEGAMCQREAFLFLSAPNAVTPLHFDPEQNFLLQVRGQKDMNVCRFPNESDQLRELERYYGGGHRNLEAMPTESETFRLEPGMGVYVPSFFPHWVQNGPRASISLSITFRTQASRRVERVHKINARLRHLGLTPVAPNVSPLRDRLKDLTYTALRGWKDPRSRLKRGNTDGKPGQR